MRCRDYLLATVSTLAMIGASGLVAPARAADLPIKAPVKAAAAPTPFSWTGFYVGGHAGGGWLDHKQTTFENNGACTAVNNINTCEFSPSGGVFGGFAGYNFQSGNIVYGIEADGSWVGLKHSQPFAASAGLPSVDPVVYGKVDWLATVRGRLGVALSPTMIYVTAGAAFGGVDSGWDTGGTDISGPVRVLDRKTRLGWVAGGGIEHAFAGNWSVRAEVLYHDLGKDTGAFTLGSTTYSTTFRHRVTTARAGVALRW